MFNSLVFTVKTAAAQLDCHPDTVRAAIYSGELIARKRFRKWYIMPDDLLLFVKAGEHSQPIALAKQKAKQGKEKETQHSNSPNSTTNDWEFEANEDETDNEDQLGHNLADW